jgi:hypothetical protein
MTVYMSIKTAHDENNVLRYYINDIKAPELELKANVIYIIDQSDTSNQNKPLKFSTTIDGIHNGGVEYNQNIEYSINVPGTSGSYTKISSPVNLSLHYYCSLRSGMGNSITFHETQNITYNVSVQNNNDNDIKFYIDDQESPELNIKSNITYIFDTSDPTNLDHLLGFSAGPDGTNEYQDGLTRINDNNIVQSINILRNGVPGESGSFVSIIVENINKIYYFCKNHSNMGNVLNITVYTYTYFKEYSVLCVPDQEGIMTIDIGSNTFTNEQNIDNIGSEQFVLTYSTGSNILGDPYVTAINGKVSKLPSRHSNYRLFENSDIFVNVEIDYQDISSTIYNYCRIHNINYSVFYDKDIITNGYWNSKLWISSEDHTLNFDLFTKTMTYHQKYFMVNVRNKNFSYNMKLGDKTIYKTIDISWLHSKLGIQSISVDFYLNPQIMNGIRMKTPLLYSKKSLGLLVTNYRFSLMKIKKLTDTNKHKIIKKLTKHKKQYFNKSIMQKGEIWTRGITKKLTYVN